jgi:hypothetical protein
MFDFTNKIILDNRDVFFKELKVKHLKVIYKLLISDEPDPEIVFYNFNKLLTCLTSLQPNEIQELNFIDYFFLLIKIRVLSAGGVIFAQLEDSNTKIEFNLNKILEQLENLNTTYQNKKRNIDRSVVIYDLPTINEIYQINQNNNIDNFYSSFIKYLKINNNTLSLKQLPYKDKNFIFEQLPAKVTSTIIKDTLECIKHFNSVNLISYIPQLKNVSLYFNFNIKNLVMFLKFLFGDGLLSLYENIFALCKLGNFSPDYIENCTPGEYLLFVKKLEQLNSQKNTTQNNSIEEFNDNLQEDSFSDLNPYNSPDMPPITSQANLANFMS